MRPKPFNELRKRMTPEQKAASETRVQLALLHLALMELQKSSRISQDDIDKDLNVLQSALFELEQDDIQVSTLSRYIKALGGNLKLVAHFPDKEIVLSQFE